MPDSEPSPAGETAIRVEDAWHYPWGEPELNKTARFLDSLSKSKIETTKCKKCSTVQWPPRSICSNCLSLDLEWITLPETGKLDAFTQAYIGASHSEKTPIAVGAVHLEGGIRLLARLAGARVESLETGMKVRFAGAKLVGGKPFWEFTPAEPERQ